VGATGHAPVANREVATVVGAIVLGGLLGAAVAHGAALLVVAAALALGALAVVLVRPEALLLAWFAAVLVNGRELTYQQVGPLYVTEPLLALLVFGVAMSLLLRLSAQPGFLEDRRGALRYVIALTSAMLIPALAGLALQTSTFDYAAARNLLLVIYPLFAVIVVCVTDLGTTYRRWFAVALAAPTLALIFVAMGGAGEAGATSTGAMRVAGYTFALAFGIAPIVLVAAARERLIRPLWAGVAVVPFLIGLLLVNHRSAWLAFVAAAIFLFVKRITPAVVVGTLALVVGGVVILTSQAAESSSLGAEVARAKTVTSTTDPNASFRLSFWQAAMSKSITSPLIGNGFDLYPEDIVPPTPGNIDEFPSPHNSFVAIAYRAGFIPFLIVLGLLLNLIRRGYRASQERPAPHDRAICSALTAIVIYTGVTSSFNVFLEAPYAGPLFWTCVGLLAYVVYADPVRSQVASQFGMSERATR
jgi:cell division protein FtsW (lipid II flippase)